MWFNLPFEVLAARIFQLLTTLGRTLNGAFELFSSHAFVPFEPCLDQVSKILGDRLRSV
jgi:hypothetical protein